ncbi:MAG: hypothetical protein N2689_08375 [Verrucomicrobiae bacterium]|nr:hypothetical protein [Verrucomicrobiae bacterium]
MSGKTKWKSLKTRSINIPKRNLAHEASQACQNAAEGRTKIEDIKTFSDVPVWFAKPYQANLNLRPPRRRWTVVKQA